MIDRIRADTVSAPGGHYSHAIRHGGLLYVSGQLPIAPDGAILASASFDDQVRQVLDNLLAIAAAGDCGAQDFVKVTAYVVDIGDWPRFDAIYAEVMGDARPARAVVPVPELHHGCRVEVEAIAAIPPADGHRRERQGPRSRSSGQTPRPRPAPS